MSAKHSLTCLSQSTTGGQGTEFLPCTCGAQPAAAQEQPRPTVNNGPCVQDLVIADIEARKQNGIRKYGTTLQPHNGRNALLDAYQETLDLAMYLKQRLIEEGIL